MAIPRFVRLYGEDKPPPEQVPLRAGPLSLIYEAGDLRYIRVGPHEILRRVYVAVRDRNWSTAPAEIDNLQMDVADDHFEIRYDVVNRLNDIDFAWQGVITGTAQGEIRFSMDGAARATFLRNRIGFCILHPMACAGAQCRIKHVDGSEETAQFPVQIAPQLITDGQIRPVSPFEEMQSLTHEILPGLWAKVQFEGDIFETEDQRNWTDASYKTYSTPLRLQFPVEVSAGTEIRQAITLSLDGSLPEADTVEEKKNTITVATGRSHALPKVGLGVASHGQPLDTTAVSRLRALNLSHLRVDLVLATQSYVERLRQGAQQAQELGTELEVALFLSDQAEAELQQLAGQLNSIRPTVSRWLVFHKGEATTSARWVELARPVLSAYHQGALVSGGTNVYFTDLNRNRPEPDPLDFVAYSLNPQVHAFDNASLVETMAAQAATVTSARQFSGGLPVVVSPVTLKPRFNPNATSSEPETPPDMLPPQVDVRQMSLLGAGWTMGSLKYLCESKVEAVTYFETTGWRGVMETAAGSALPERFPSIAGAVFPLYHVLADLGEFAEGNVVATEASHPLQVDGFSMSQGDRTRTLVANLSPATQPVTVQNLPRKVRIAMLQETNVVDAMTEPEQFRRENALEYEAAGGVLSLTLPPYALARIDSA